MSLNSFSFIVFFSLLIVVLSALQLFRKKYVCLEKIQLLLILVFSYLFLLKASWQFSLCIASVTLLAYGFGIWIYKSHSKKILALGIISLGCFLAYFKYTNFFVDSFCKIAGLNAITLNIILPLGISFYIFSTLSYLIDIYRKDYPPERRFFLFALYVVYFPKLTAGPIVRANDFFPQVKKYRGIEWEEFKIGLQIFVFGLFKKIVLADHLGVFVDDVFHAPMAFSTGTIILAAVSYSLQIYFDFSGYSDMAIGTSKILGFDFKPNFNLPYTAHNISEFWKRWHISLSSWFQDYLYIPLGGSRKGRNRTYINTLIVMIISGLWHGAGWTFVAWGTLHGIISCVDRATRKKLNRLGLYINIFITFTFVTIFWVFFRADNFDTAIAVLRGIFTPQIGICQPYTWSFFAIGCLLVSTFVALVHSKQVGDRDKTGHIIINGFYPILDLSKFWSQVIFLTFCGLTLMVGYFGGSAFIYGAF